MHARPASSPESQEQRELRSTCEDLVCALEVPSQPGREPWAERVLSIAGLTVLRLRRSGELVAIIPCRGTPHGEELVAHLASRLKRYRLPLRALRTLILGRPLHLVAVGLGVQPLHWEGAPPRYMEGVPVCCYGLSLGWGFKCLSGTPSRELLMALREASASPRSAGSPPWWLTAPLTQRELERLREQALRRRVAHGRLWLTFVLLAAMLLLWRMVD